MSWEAGSLFEKMQANYLIMWGGKCLTNLGKKHVVNSDKEGMYTHFDEYVYRYITIGDIILSKDYLKFN